jgi:hypothetical protein
MHSASSRTSYLGEPALKRTAAKALSATRPVCLFALRGLRPERFWPPFVPEVTGDLIPARSCLPDGISSGSRLLAGPLHVSSQRLACWSNSAHGSFMRECRGEGVNLWQGTHRSRHHRAETTPQERPIMFPLTCLSSLTRSSIRPYSECSRQTSIRRSLGSKARAQHAGR